MKKAVLFRGRGQRHTRSSFQEKPLGRPIRWRGRGGRGHRRTRRPYPACQELDPCKHRIRQVQLAHDFVV